MAEPQLHSHSVAAGLGAAIFAAAVLAAVFSGLPATAAAGRAPFQLAFKGERTDLALTSVFLLPGEAVEIEALGPGGRLEAQAESGDLVRRGMRAWSFRAPDQPGLARLRVGGPEPDQGIDLQAFVMVPYDGGEELNGYPIGRYRTDAGLPPPAGFVEVTEENAGQLLTPHLALGQFVCKQACSGPRYVVLTEGLLHKLEGLIDHFAAAGLPAGHLAVLSGFRSPAYNRAIGNDTSLSRHLYGQAADIFLDEDGDGRMDDLNGDGRSDLADAQLLAEEVEKAEGEEWCRPYTGGLAAYGATAGHGPFIHVDVRGRPARW